MTDNEQELIEKEPFEEGKPISSPSNPSGVPDPSPKFDANKTEDNVWIKSEQDKAEQSKEPNKVEGNSPIAPSASVMPLSLTEERTWAMLAHLTVLINLFTGWLGIGAAFIIYLVYKDRSKYVAYQAMQSVILQAIAFVGGGLIIASAWIITILLSMILVGLICIPFALIISLLPVAAIVYAIIAAVETNSGRDFKYWLIGDWVRGIYEG